MSLYGPLRAMTPKERLKAQRRIARGFGVPDSVIGLDTPWWRRWWQSRTRRPGQYQ
jgi:hypothetical protein